ncbi:MAG: NIPSNAP family protein [Planctomycetaceae bacterium]|nr:NIPSNAP family protein [Planctomycetaceae bacterium]
MRTHVLAGGLWAIGLITLVPADVLHAKDSPVYELRIYKCEPGKLPALNERFRNHTLRLFEKHGMENVAYWIPTDEPQSTDTLIYVLRHASRDVAKQSWKAFLEDPEWQAVAKASQEKDGKILAGPPISVYMAPTDFSPEIGPARHDRLYELRVYTAAEGKLDAMHARFRDHTDRLFARHGLRSYAYWQATDAPQSKTTMYYILESPGREQAQESWKAFGADPEWQAAKQASEVNGSLLAQRPESTYMTLVDYSPAE